jgi:hypothetical protein
MNPSVIQPVLLQSSLIPWMSATLFASLVLALSPSTSPIPKALHNSSLGLLDRNHGLKDLFNIPDNSLTGWDIIHGCRIQNLMIGWAPLNGVNMLNFLLQSSSSRLVVSATCASANICKSWLRELPHGPNGSSIMAHPPFICALKYNKLKVFNKIIYVPT